MKKIKKAALLLIIALAIGGVPNVQGSDAAETTRGHQEIYKECRPRIKIDKSGAASREHPANSNSINSDYTTAVAIVTAYAPFDNKSGICNDGDPTSTATGTYPKKGTLAADPDRLPYGTQIDIPGYGPGIVEDTGGALRNDKENIRIDVYMDSYEEAIEWGRQELIIKIKGGNK